MLTQSIVSRLDIVFKRKVAFACAVFLTSGSLGAPALAETLARANGPCSFRENSHEVFNGYCTVKQKQNGSTTIFVVDLDR